MYFTLGQLIDIGSDEHGTFGHAQEYVGRSCNALADSCAQYLLQYPAQFDDHPLHGAQIVEYRYEETEEEDHGQYAKGKGLCVNQEVAEYKACSFCGIVQKRGHLVAQTLEDISTHRPAYAKDSKEKLAGDSRNHNAPLDGTAFGGEEESAEYKETRCHQGHQFLRLIPGLEEQEYPQDYQQYDNQDG